MGSSNFVSPVADSTSSQPENVKQHSSELTPIDNDQNDAVRKNAGITQSENGGCVDPANSSSTSKNGGERTSIQPGKSVASLVPVSDAIGNSVTSEGTEKETSRENGDNGKSVRQAPVSERPIPPVLKGTLSYNEVSRRHILRGMWNYESGSQFPPQRFELNRSLDPDEDPTILPKDGVFHGTFSLAYFHINAKGKRREKSKVIHEKDVQIVFKKQEGKEEVYNVNGEGTNQFGLFQINGVATKDEFEKELQYKVELRKKYASPPNAIVNPSSPRKSKNKSKKRKLNNMTGEPQIDSPKDEGPLPPPSEMFPRNVYCLRGKLARHASDQNEAGHKVSGLWSSGLDLIEADPENKQGLCNVFEYEQRCSATNKVFPLSGKYAGWFNISKEDGNLTRIQEKDVTLKFRRNNAGYHNVEGKGSNAFGKFSISGTLKDSILTIFRHFHQPRMKKKSVITQSTVGPLNGSASVHQPVNETGNSQPPMELDDVIIPEQESYDPIVPPTDGEYAALSRGVFRINSNDENHTCSGKWAMTRSHHNIPNMASNFCFGLEAHHIATAVEDMKRNNLVEKDANIVFPVDSVHYKGSFKMKRGTAKLQSVVDKQIVLKFRKNTKGSFNVHGKGVNSLGVFKLIGTLIKSSATSGHAELFRIYEPQMVESMEPTKPPPQSKTLPLSKHALPVRKNNTNESGVDAAVQSDQVSSVTNLLPAAPRRESSRQIKLPSRLEDNNPETQKLRIMEKCQSILKLLMQKDGLSGRFFCEPVDPVAHGIPMYHQIITNPMDLGTIQAKMNTGEIESQDEFSRLVRLVFENALKFNVDPSHVVHQAAQNLLSFFNQKFRDVERMTEKKKLSKAETKEIKRKQLEEKKRLDKEKKRKKDSSLIEDSQQKRLKVLKTTSQEVTTALDALSLSVSNEHGPLRNVLRLMHKQISHIQEILLSTLNHPTKKVTTAAVPDPTTSIVSSSKALIDPPTGKKSRKKKNTKPKQTKDPSGPVPSVIIEEPLTLEEQQDLTEAINKLPDETLPFVIDIIRESADLNADEEEIDVEIDKIDTATQRKLQKFVLKNKPKGSKKVSKKKTPPPATPATVKGEAEQSKPPTEISPKQQSMQNDDPHFTFGEDGDDSDSDESVTDKQETKSPSENPNEFKFSDDIPNDDSDSIDGVGMAPKWDIKEQDSDQDTSSEQDDDWAKLQGEHEAQQTREKEREAQNEKFWAEKERSRKEKEKERLSKIENDRIKVEADRSRRQAEKEEEERKRVELLKKKVADSNNIRQTVDMDEDRDAMEEYMEYGGGESPASSNFGF